jgi:hypothetical protein
VFGTCGGEVFCRFGLVTLVGIDVGWAIYRKLGAVGCQLEKTVAVTAGADWPMPLGYETDLTVGDSVPTLVCTRRT